MGLRCKREEKNKTDVWGELLQIKNKLSNVHLCENGHSFPIVSSYTNRAYRFVNTFPLHLHKLCVVCGIVSFFPRGFVYLFPCATKSVSHCPSICSGGWRCSCWLLVAGDDTVQHFSRRQPAQRPAQLQSRRLTAKHTWREGKRGEKQTGKTKID